MSMGDIMKILLLGSTGRVGSIIVKLLIEAGHEVTVLIRNKEKLTMKHSNLIVIEGNSLNKQDLDIATNKVEGVISALNTDNNQTIHMTMSTLIPILERKKIHRFVTIGTAGILQSRIQPSKLKYLSSESKRKSTKAAEDHEKAYHLLKQSTLDWTIICPTYLPDGPITKIYRTEIDFLPVEGSSISTGDTAYFTVKEFFQNDSSRKRVGICY